MWPILGAAHLQVHREDLLIAHPRVGQHSIASLDVGKVSAGRWNRTAHIPAHVLDEPAQPGRSGVHRASRYR